MTGRGISGDGTATSRAAASRDPRAESSHRRLTIVIVTYNCRQEVDDCLRSLADAPPAVAHEIVVVDNASADDTAAHVRTHWPAVRLIDAGGNLGFARANNIGIRASAGELVLLLNPDTIVPPDAIDTLIRTLDAHPDAAAAGPRLVDAGGRVELSFGAMIAPLAELRQKVLAAASRRGTPLLARHVERMTRHPRIVDWVSGACLLARRPDLEAVGLLDERFLMYTEDVDLCAAFRARGRTIRFVPGAEIVHLRGRSGASSRSATYAAYRRSHLAFYEKHHPHWVPLLKVYSWILNRSQESGVRSQERH